MEAEGANFIMKYNTLLFDVDNTLLDFDANEAESFHNMILELGEVYTEELYQTYKSLNAELWKKIERREISVEEGVNTRFSELMRRYGRDVDGRHWETIYRRYLNRGIQQIPFVHEVLTKLKESCRLYVITNGMEETQAFRMGKSGLAAYFQDFFISEKIGANKPSKEYFDYVKTHIPEFDAASTLVIGDSLTSDIKGGHDAGIDTCWFTRDRGGISANSGRGDVLTGQRGLKDRNTLDSSDEAAPTYVIHELPELLTLLAQT